MVFILLILLLLASNASALDAEDEFAGPFSTWTNVKTTYGAVGNGVADDTTALQAAFTALGSGGIHTLYVPSGTYNISTKLRLENKININIIGEHPTTTTLKWVGAAGQDLIYTTGMRYSRIGRLTLDGNSTARALIDQSWDSILYPGSFDTGNEYLDIVWKNSDHGLWCGTAGQGCAETTVRRNAFSGIPGSCIQLWNFNALDMWVWDSTFTGCARGITNNTGAGAFRAYRNFFQNSTVADLSVTNAQVFSARDNFSINSAQFFLATPTGNAAPTTLQGNVVIDSTNDKAIEIHNHGPLLLFDNVVRIKSGGTAPQVLHAQDSNSDTITFGNTYSIASPVSWTGRIYPDNDLVVDRATISGTIPTMPDFAVSQGRTVFEVPAGSSVATIQGAINSAVAANNKAIVHLQAGTSNIGTTLVVPANADIQLVGDGFGVSILSWNGAPSVPMMQIIGPTKVRMQDFQLHAQNTTDALIMGNVDQVNSRIHLGQVQFRQGYGSHLLVTGLTQAQIEWINSNSAYMTGGTAVQVVGGSEPVVLYNGASSTNLMQYTTSGGGTLVVRDMYYETNSSPSFARFDDRGTVIFDSLRIAVPVLGANPGIALTNWQGSGTFLGSTLDDRFVLSGNGTQTQFLGFGMLGGADVTPYLVNTLSPAGNVVLANSRRRLSGGGSEYTTTVGTIVANTVRDMLALTRSIHMPRMVENGAGVSDIRLQRVWIRDARNAISIQGGTVGVFRLIR
jgi:Pectate lyase superfamily protein